MTSDRLANDGCRGVLLGCLCLLFVGLAACLPSASALPPLPTLTPLPPNTSTPTVVWFPPTATSTPFPTAVFTPTPDLRPGVGAVLFEDDFSSGEGWGLKTSPAGNVALGNRSLTIALAAPKAYLYSVREQPVFGNFYVEITAEARLCHGLDEFGLLVRVSPTLDFYRFSLSCDGQTRMERVVGGEVAAPRPWQPSGALLPGGLLPARLGVWALGKEMRFFVNDVYQFSVSDPLLPSGSLGVFARAAGDLAVTVNFSQLVVREVIK